MAVPALYGIVARRFATGELVEFESVGDILDLAPLLASYSAKYSDRPDVLIDLDTTPSVPALTG